MGIPGALLSIRLFHFFIKKGCTIKLLEYEIHSRIKKCSMYSARNAATEMSPLKKYSGDATDLQQNTIPATCAKSILE